MAEAGEVEEVSVAADADAGCESGSGATMMGSETLEGIWGIPDDDDGEAEMFAGVSINNEDEGVEEAGAAAIAGCGGGGCSAGIV